MRPRVQRAPGIPCALFIFEGEEFHANLGRDAPRECESVSSVIASEAKQSILPRKERMDCFVAEPVIGRAFARPGGSSQ
jgi:hypothetical protein